MVGRPMINKKWFEVLLTEVTNVNVVYISLANFSVWPSARVHRPKY